MQGHDAEAVRAVCVQLDPSNDGQWTTQGLPRMDVLFGLGLTIERKVLDELLPGFNRTKLAQQLKDSAPPPQPAAVAQDAERDPYFKHMLARDKRRREALAHLESGGFTLADLADHTSPLQRRVSAQNSAARRGIT